MPMSRSSSGRHKSRCRWSEPILRRRRAVASVDSKSSKTSSLDSVESSTSASPKSPKKSSPSVSPHMTLLSCSCHQKCQKAMRHQMSSKQVEDKENSSQHDSVDALQEKFFQLDTMIHEYQGQVLVDSAHHSSLKTSLDHAKTALAFLAHYAGCLELQHSANLRLNHLVSMMLPTPSDHFSDLLKNIACEDGEKSNCNDLNVFLLKEVAELAAINVKRCEQLLKFQEEFEAKKDDILLASTNFCLLLGNVKITSGQLQKLETQYNDILSGYKQSKNILEQEILKIINNHKEVLSQCFQSLVKWLEKFGKCCTQMSELFSCLSQELKSSQMSPAGSSEVVPADASACGDPGSAIASSKGASSSQQHVADYTKLRHRQK